MKRRNWFRAHEHWIFAVLFVLLCGWAADAVKDTVEELWRAQRFYWRLLIVVVFAVITLRLYRLKTRFFDLQLEEMVPDEHPYKRKVVICFLSTAQSERCAKLAEDGTRLLFRNQSVPLDAGMFNRFSELRKQDPACTWPWEVLFRMIHYHRDALQRVILVCSQQTIVDAQLFGQIFCRFVANAQWPERPQLEVLIPRRGSFATVGTDYTFRPEDGFDFHDDFARISQAIQHEIGALEQEGYRKSEIAIDFTGGTKVTSIVAAGLTFNNSIQAQHVRYRNGDLQVVGYDMVYSNRTANEIA